MPADLPHQILQQINLGVAVAELDSLMIMQENACFFRWFPSQGDAAETLPARLPALDATRLHTQLGRGRAYSLETEIKNGPRTTSLQIEMRRLQLGDGDFILVECRDITKRKEAEYMLDSYSRMAERNARELQREKERVEKLLLNVMPRSVYQELKDFGTTTPQRFDSASVMLLDFVGFTEMAVAHDPAATVAELNDIFTAFDRIVELFDCERIKTIGDAYLAVSGIPDANTDHAQNIAKVALRARRYLERRNLAHPHQWRCRIGIHAGPLIGSLVGVQKYVYDIFGPAVNMAARLEQHAEPMQILLCEETCGLIGNEFRVSEVGEMALQGFGSRRLYALIEERGR
ncbi:MAG TPA: adenylate/guanylate cyclase domain-containing protein [Azospirillaceae bacterium]|nr:adenylate/guanylate cyclase domain-containing protein [Azospirillaceae bacterium]